MRSGLTYYEYPWPDFWPSCMPAEPAPSKCDAAVRSECTKPFEHPCEDAPDSFVATGLQHMHDFIVDLSVAAGMNQPGNHNIKREGLMDNCTALAALPGGCMVPAAEFLCPKTCGKCSERTISCLDCYTKPAFPLCYGKDASLLPQCQKCFDGSCGKCESCSQWKELVPVLAGKLKKDSTFMNGKYAFLLNLFLLTVFPLAVFLLNRFSAYRCIHTPPPPFHTVRWLSTLVCSLVRH